MLKEIIKNTLMLLGRENELEEVENLDEDSYQTSTKKIVSSLIKITNLVLSDITRDVSKLAGDVLLTSDENCQIFYSEIKEKLTGIKNVAINRFPVTFNLYPEYIKVGRPNTTYQISYYYENKPCKSINDNIVLPISITPSAVSYGVAAEYCSINLLYDECNMWEQKFVRAMENVRDKCGERKAFRWWAR